jgi:hypothetical protein
MHRNRVRIRPQVEGLESMTLLSGLATTVHAAASAMVSTPVQAVALSGTARGSYVSRQSNPDVGTTYNFSARGRITPLGQTFDFGSFRTPGFIQNGQTQGRLTLAGPRGTVRLSITEVTPKTDDTANVFHFTYTITGGTGRFRHAQGTGTLDVTLTPSTSMAGSPRFGHGKISLTFTSTPPAVA